MTLKVAIIGKGKVGGALAEGLRRGGYDTRFGTRDPGESVEDAAKWGDIVIMAVYPKSWVDLIQRAGTNLNGKIVIDVSNPVTETFDPVFDASTSAAEELQKMVPSARIVKAFNTIYARGMSDGLAKGQQQTVFVAGDDTDARKAVMEMAAKIGFDSVDTGPLKNARLLESFERLSFQLAFVMKMGPGIGFKLIH